MGLKGRGFRVVFCGLPVETSGFRLVGRGRLVVLCLVVVRRVVVVLVVVARLVVVGLTVVVLKLFVIMVLKELNVQRLCECYNMLGYLLILDI